MGKHPWETSVMVTTASSQLSGKVASQSRYVKVTFWSELNTGVKTKSPLFWSESVPLDGPLTSVTLIVPGVGGDAPLHPMSLVVTELIKIAFNRSVKLMSVALGHEPGTGVVVGI